MRSQALGLAEATGFDFVEKPLDVGWPWRGLPPQLWPLSLEHRRAAKTLGSAHLGPISSSVAAEIR